MKPRKPVPTLEWVEKNRTLAAGTTPKPGLFRIKHTPYLREILEACDDPKTWKVVCRKSAQVGWTDGVLNNLLASWIVNDPSKVILLFDRDKSVRDYFTEKFDPLLEANPNISQLVDDPNKKSNKSTLTYRQFPGGDIKGVGSNTPASVKTSPVRRVCIEEPDDCNKNVGQQGDSARLAEERTKTFPDRKVVYGGTPSILGFSQIDNSYKESDQRYYYVPCPNCETEQVLTWEQVYWETDDSIDDPIFKNNLPETAKYQCINSDCKELWDDAQRIDAINKGVWKATEKFRGIKGFHIDELMSTFEASYLEVLVTRYLKAKLKLDRGDPSEMVVFHNSALGLAYEYNESKLDSEQLDQYALDYPSSTVHENGLVLTIGVDVQHDRFAFSIRAWGREGFSYLVLWREIHGNVLNRHDPVWEELESYCLRGYQHACKQELFITAGSIDSGDGTTSDLVYAFVRKMNRQHGRRHFLAIKGASHNQLDKEIFTQPRPSMDLNRKNKAEKYGLKVFIVGTQKAKYQIERELNLHKEGNSRFHYYAGVSNTYFKQLTAEKKVPIRKNSNQLIFVCPRGVRNEALDCEVYAMHAAYGLKLHIKKENYWADIESKMKQKQLFPSERPKLKMKRG